MVCAGDNMRYEILKYENIRSLRIDGGYTQRQIAEVLGVSQNTYSQYEIGVVNYSVEALEKLADFYGVRVASAKPKALRFWVPPKMTSSIFAPRRVLLLCSPMTQRMASEIFDLPEPLGPTMAVISSPKRISVLSGKDLKPCNSNDFRYTVISS